MSNEENPYVSPTPLASDQSLGSDGVEYQSALSRSKWATVLLATTAAASPLMALGMLQTAQLLARMRSGVAVADADADRTDLVVAGSAVIMVIGFIGSIITFCLWTHRAHRNLQPLRASGLRYTSGWAVGSFFVPILNLFRPYQIMQEIARGSDPNTIGEDIYSSRGVKSSSLVKWWWAAWLIMGFMDRASNALDRRAVGANDLQALIAAARFSVFASAMVLPAAILAILVIRKIQRNQDERHDRLMTPE
jgi:hypothetical protein